MAELIGGPLLSASFQILLDRAASPEVIDFLKGRKIDDQLLTNLKSTMRSLRMLLDDAEEKQISKPAVREWLHDIKDAVYQAGDFLDEVAFEALRSKLETGFQVKNFFSSRNPFNKGMKAKLLEILEKLEALLKLKDTLQLIGGGIGENPFSHKVPSTCLIHQSGVYGRDDDRKSLINLLLPDDGNSIDLGVVPSSDDGNSNNLGVVPSSDDGNSNDLGVIPIWGMAGVGKTTLAQIVYNDKAVEGMFHVKAWVCVSGEFNVPKVTKDILLELGRKTDGNSLNQLQLELKQELKGKKFLLVLDDVWTVSYADWDMLRVTLKYGARGSKIVVTTRDRNVASTMCTVQPQQLKELNDDDCWLLFAKHAFEDGNFKAYPKLEAIGREMVKKCQGLPLAAKTLGGLLRSEREVSEWKKILESNIWDMGNDEVLPALRLSYHYLPSHLKQCFAYSALFSKGYLFEKEELILLWMAEGFLMSDGNMAMQEIGDGYFNDLVSRSFFQRSSVLPSCFVMHGLVSDLAKYVSGDFCFRLEGDMPYCIPKKTRHISYSGEEYGAFGRYKSICEAPFLRTLLLAEWSWIDKKAMNYLFPKLGRIRVLSLSQHHSIRELPRSIGNLKHLRYLNLAGASIKSLPQKVTALYNLQILILCHCKDLVELPSEFRRLINLCHLDIRDTKLQRMPSEMGKLTKLEKLTDFVVEKLNGSSIKELGKLQHLRGQLSISNLQNVVFVLDALDANLKGKKHLKELELRWSGDNGNSSHEKDILGKLEPHTNLECLSIVGYGYSVFPDWVGDSSYSNIVSLKLSGCKNIRSLPPFGQLQFLKDLSVREVDGVIAIGPEFFGSSMSKVRPFASLEILRFEMMPQWHEWISFEDNAEGGAFPLLQQLYVRECPNLRKALPSNLPSLTTLEIEGCQQLVASIPKAPSILRIKLKDDIRLLRLAKKPNGMYRFAVDGLRCIDSLLEEMKQIGGLYSSIEEIDIGNCDSLKCFPLWLFCKLRILRISRCRSLESLFEPEATKVDFSSLSSLEIKECPDLVSFYKGEISFPNLTRLLLLGCPNVESFPGKMKLSSTLTSLKIWGFQNLKSLDHNGFQHLRSLRELEIFECPMLKSIPEEGLPSSLSSLTITLCPLLERRCRQQEGEDWHKIAHIAHLQIGFRKIH